MCDWRAHDIGGSGGGVDRRGRGSGRVGFTIMVVVVHDLGFGRGRDDSTGEDKAGGSGQKKKSHDVSLCFLFLP